MIKLGDRVKDNITGYTGIATAMSEWLYGCKRVNIQPEDLDNHKVRDEKSFDEQRIEVVQKKKVDWKTPEFETGLGDKVKCKITGFEGICIGRVHFLFGNNRIIIQPEELKDGKIIDDECLEENRFEILESKKPKVSKDSTAKTGGPQKEHKTNRHGF